MDKLGDLSDGRRALGHELGDALVVLRSASLQRDGGQMLGEHEICRLPVDIAQRGGFNCFSIQRIVGHQELQRPITNDQVLTVLFRAVGYQIPPNPGERGQTPGLVPRDHHENIDVFCGACLDIGLGRHCPADGVLGHKPAFQNAIQLRNDLVDAHEGRRAWPKKVRSAGYLEQPP